MTPKAYVESLTLLGFQNVFNPYSNRCPIYDLDDAPKRRQEMLLSMLEVAVATDVDSIWVGRDLGYRGGRRTGLALTDECHLFDHTNRWGVTAARSTTGVPFGERTAKVIWSALTDIRVPIFLWNVFPFHPHHPQEQLTNRPHGPRERQIGEDLLVELIRLINPRRLVGLGNDAAAVLARVRGNREAVQLRHPSYGGQKTFLRQVLLLYQTRFT
jgi:hypothetical protein